MDRVDLLSAAIQAHRKAWQRANGSRRDRARPTDLVLWDAHDLAMASSDDLPHKEHERTTDGRG